MKEITKKLLIRSGWNEGRCIDTSPIRKRYEEIKLEYPENVDDFLKEFGDAVGGFTGTECDAILPYIDDTIKGGNLENVDKTISQFISQDVSNSIYSRIEKEIGDRGMDYIDDVVGEAKISRIPNRINLNTE